MVDGADERKHKTAIADSDPGGAGVKLNRKYVTCDSEQCGRNSPDCKTPKGSAAPGEGVGNDQDSESANERDERQCEHRGLAEADSMVLGQTFVTTAFLHRLAAPTRSIRPGLSLHHRIVLRASSSLRRKSPL